MKWKGVMACDVLPVAMFSKGTRRWKITCWNDSQIYCFHFLYPTVFKLSAYHTDFFFVTISHATIWQTYLSSKWDPHNNYFGSIVSISRRLLLHNNHLCNNHSCVFGIRPLHRHYCSSIASISHHATYHTNLFCVTIIDRCNHAMYVF